MNRAWVKIRIRYVAVKVRIRIKVWVRLHKRMENEWKSV